MISKMKRERKCRFSILKLILLAISMFCLPGWGQRHEVCIETPDSVARFRTREVATMCIEKQRTSLTLRNNEGTTINWPQEEIHEIYFTTDDAKTVNYSILLENPNVHWFLTEVKYDADDYTYSLVDNYRNLAKAEDQPCPIVIRLESEAAYGGEYVILSRDRNFSTIQEKMMTGDSLVIWNTAPGDTLYYRIMDADRHQMLQQGYATGYGQLRMIYAPSVHNIRDLGGWPVEGGGHIKYGRLFRGAKFHDKNGDLISAEDVERLRELGIRCEIDLRGGTEAGNALTSNYYSRLGRDVYYYINGHGMYAYTDAVTYADYFRYGWNAIKNYLKRGEGVYLHCSAGCDRAGTWSFLIGGMLGMSENDLTLDYEMGCFSENPSHWRHRNEYLKTPSYDFYGLMKAFKEMEGETLQDKCVNFMVKRCLIPRSEIESVQKAMIER